MDYGLLDSMAIVLGLYLAWRRDDRKTGRRTLTQELRQARQAWIFERDSQAMDTEVTAGESDGDGGGGDWDFGGWDD